MLEKYRATIHGDTIEWDGNGPNGLADGQKLRVEITVVSEPKTWPKPDGKRMVAALEQIAALGGVRSIPDPVAWQQEIREDRPLPGRE